MNVTRIAIVAHDKKAEAKEAKEALARWIESRDLELVETAPDLVVSLGGDGTMLRAAQLAHSEDAPLVGVNLGRVGYLTEVEMGREQEALQAIFDGAFELEERMML